MLWKIKLQFPLKAFKKFQNKTLSCDKHREIFSSKTIPQKYFQPLIYSSQGWWHHRTFGYIWQASWQLSSFGNSPTVGVSTETWRHNRSLSAQLHWIPDGCSGWKWSWNDGDDSQPNLHSWWAWNEIIFNQWICSHSKISQSREAFLCQSAQR